MTNEQADNYVMKIGRHRSDEQEPAAAPAAPGPELLREQGLLAPWYIALRLDEELERARRHDRPIALIVASPQLLPGEQLSPSVRDAAAAAALRGARRYDLVGWLDSLRVIVLMLDTVETEARAAAERIRLEMWRGSTSVGGQKWTVVQIADARSCDDAAAVFASLQRLDAAA